MLVYKLLVLIAVALLTSPCSEAGQANLSWTPPTLNDDGTPLTDLAFYEIHSGCLSPGIYDRPIEFILAPASSHTVLNLPDVGSCYFAAKAVNTSGVLSVFSNEAVQFMGLLQLPDVVANTNITWKENQTLVADITFVAAGTIAVDGSLAGITGQNAALPAGVLQKDFLIIFSHRNDNDGNFDTLSGWIKPSALEQQSGPGSDLQTVVYYKIAGSSESDVTVTHSDTTDESWCTVMLAYRGVDTTTPFDVTPTASHVQALQNKPSPNIDAFKEITTVTNGALVIAFESVTHSFINSDADPSGYTIRARHANPALANHSQLQVWDKIVLVAGSVTPGAPPYTSRDVTAESHLATIAIRPYERIN